MSMAARAPPAKRALRAAGPPPGRRVTVAVALEVLPAPEVLPPAARARPLPTAGRVDPTVR